MKISGSNIPQDVIRRARSGEKVKDIAAFYKVSGSIIYSILNMHKEATGESFVRSKRRITPSPKISKQHFNYLKKTLKGKSPSDLGIAQEPGKSGWTEYEVRELLEKQFGTRFTFVDCLEHLLKLDVPIGKHTRVQGFGVTEKRLKQLPAQFTRWLDTQGAAQKKREDALAKKFTAHVKMTHLIGRKKSINTPDSWAHTYHNLILRDPLSKHPDLISKAISKLIQ